MQGSDGGSGSACRAVLGVLLLICFAYGSLSGCSRTMLSGKDMTRRLASSESERALNLRRNSVRVWFVKPSAGELKLVSVVRPCAQDDVLRDAVNELLRGPDTGEAGSGLASEIPRGTVLIDVKQVEHIVELNLSKRFAAEGGITSFETRMEQLRRTVDGAANGSKVYLNVEGQRLTADSGEGLEIKQPIN